MDAINDLYALTLVDGLPATVEGRKIFYRTVRLRDTTVADERAAQRQAERVVTIDGAPRLLVSDADFRFALTARHIASFECDGFVIPQGLVDLELMGKLSSHDLGLIEQRVFVITLAAEVRYGNITQAEFDGLVTPQANTKAPGAPQPVGQAAALGSNAPFAESGPALLTDFARRTPGGQVEVDGG
jgi:phage FluMu protein gp41